MMLSRNALLLLLVTRCISFTPVLLRHHLVVPAQRPRVHIRALSEPNVESREKRVGTGSAEQDGDRRPRNQWKNQGSSQKRRQQKNKVKSTAGAPESSRAFEEFRDLKRCRTEALRALSAAKETPPRGDIPSEELFEECSVLVDSDVESKWAHITEAEEVALYEKAAFECFGGNNWQHGQQIIQEMEFRGGEFSPRADLYARAVHACTRCGKWQAALRTFDAASTLLDQQEEELQQKLQQQKLQKEQQEEVNAGESSSESSSSSSSSSNPLVQRKHGNKRKALRGLWLAALEACGAGGQWEKALELLDRFEASGVDHKTNREEEEEAAGRGGSGDVSVSAGAFVHAIKACERAGQWRRALSLLNRGRDCGALEYHPHFDVHLQTPSKTRTAAAPTDAAWPPRLPSILPYNMVIAALARGGQWREAQALLSELESGQDARGREHAQRQKQIQARRQAAAAAAAAASASGGSSSSNQAPLRGVSRVEMGPRIPSPTIVTYNSVIGACGKAGRWREALQLLAALKMRNSNNNDNGGNRGGGDVTAVAASAGATKQQQPGQPGQRKRQAQSPPLVPDVVTYTAAITACAKAKPVARPEKALELLATMRAEGVAPDVFAYTAVIDACAKGGKLQWVGGASAGAGATTMKAFSKATVSATAAPSPPSLFVPASTARTGPQRALELLDEMRLQGLRPNGHTYGCAVNACASEGKWERALELLEAAREALGTAQVGLPVYNAALRACERGGQPARAVALLQRMEQEASFGSPTEDAGGSKAKSGGNNNQKQGQQQSRGSSRGSSVAKAPSPDVRSYTAAISACAKAGSNTLRGEEEDEASGVVDPETGLAMPWWRVALDLFERAKRGGPATWPNMFAYSAAMSACANAGQWQSATQILAEMESMGMTADLVAYNTALHAHRVGGNWRGATTTLKKMLESAATPLPPLSSVAPAAPAASTATAPPPSSSSSSSYSSPSMPRSPQSSPSPPSSSSSINKRATVTTARTSASDGPLVCCAPDAISVGSAIGSLADAHARGELDASFVDTEADWLFEAAVAQRSPCPIFFAPPCLDSLLEVDLTTMPLPVARAAVRWSLRRVLDSQGVGAAVVESGSLPQVPSLVQSGDSSLNLAPPPLWQGPPRALARPAWEDDEIGGDGGWFLGGDYAGGGGGGVGEVSSSETSRREIEQTAAWAAAAAAGLEERTAVDGDLTFITGVGVAHTAVSARNKNRLAAATSKLMAAAAADSGEKSGSSSTNTGRGEKEKKKKNQSGSGSGEKLQGELAALLPSSPSSSPPSSLRQFVQEVLCELGLPVSAVVVPRDSPGTVVVERGALVEWVEKQRRWHGGEQGGRDFLL